MDKEDSNQGISEIYFTRTVPDLRKYGAVAVQDLDEGNEGNLYRET